MFSSKVKLALIVYVFLILSIPVGAYLASESRSKDTKTSASTPKETTSSLNLPVTKPITKEATQSGAKQITSLLEEVNNLSNPTPSPTTSSDGSPTIATSFGPTLSMNLNLEGRPADKQKSQAFVGITDANSTQNPQYILSFTIDIPDNGAFTGLSLAGLNVGSQYMAVVKPTAQIAKAITFTMLPGVTELNQGAVITLLSGDLNEDNVINTADFNICKNAYGSTPGKSNWNELADLNKDDIVNNYDIAYIYKNFGQTGDSGVWGSTPPSQATASGSLAIENELIPSSNSATTTHPTGSSSGYWMWIPQ